MFVEVVIDWFVLNLVIMLILDLLIVFEGEWGEDLFLVYGFILMMVLGESVLYLG